MEEFNFNTIAKWLDTTDQQLHIIKIIYRLENRENEIKPKTITQEYEKQYNKRIQKPNLFTMLKNLIDKELIHKDEEHNYRTNFNGIKKALEKHKEKIKKEGEEFQKAYSKTEEYFKRNIPTGRLSVDYYEQKELYAEMTKSINNSDTVNIVTSFPNIAYTYNLASGIDRLEYIETLWKRCLKEKNLDINYLTTLDTDYLFNQAFRALEEPKLAFKECELVLKQLASQNETQKKLHIKIVEEQKGMDVLIPIKEKPLEVYMFIKDEHKEIQGGIRIRSAETAYQAENMFKLGFNYAENLSQNTIEKTHKKLKQEYGILE